MKLTYLGTAAAEGFPAVFCNCDFCAEARRLGGKNIRTRSQALVNDDLLIDLPADTYFHFLREGIEADRIAYLLITHAHADHLYAKELDNRHPPYGHAMRAPTLHVYGSAGTRERMGQLPAGVDMTVLAPFETATVGPYRVTPLPARHMPGAEPFIYVIEGDRTLLYAHDTGYPTEDVLRFIKERGFLFDMVSLDCTSVDIPIGDDGHHMGFPNIARLLGVLEDMGAITADTVRYVNHFSHNGNPLHEHLTKRAATIGAHPSYDGCTVVF